MDKTNDDIIIIQSLESKISNINFDEDKNKHYSDDYQLFNQTLIVAKYQNGKQVKWKACDKVWELLGDRKKFDKYIKDEVNKYLKG